MRRLHLGTFLMILGYFQIFLLASLPAGFWANDILAAAALATWLTALVAQALEVDR